METGDIFERIKQTTHPVDYDAILESEAPFVDFDFPPGEKSLFSSDNHWVDSDEEEKEHTNLLNEVKTQRWKTNFEWRRLSEIFEEEYHILGDNIGAKDIKQGALGDCYFLSALAAIVTNGKEELYKIFMMDKGYNMNPTQTSIFPIKLLVNGCYEIIVVDDYIPYDTVKNKIAFCSTYSTNIWAILLEKAFAKLNGSYEDIIRGKASEALGFLLPYSVKWFDHYDNTKEQLEKLWNRISKRSTAGKTTGSGKKKITKGGIASTLIATAATGKNDKKKQRKKECEEVGLNFKHAYTILDSFILKKDKFNLEKDYRIMKIKNPKIQKWNGDWSAESSLWTDKIKEYVNYNCDDKGELFITFEDYGAYFYKTTVCFYRPKMKFNNLILYHPNDSDCLVKFSISKEADIHFKIVQMQRCLFPRSLKYKIAGTHLVVGKLGKDKVKYICSDFSFNSQNFSIKPKNSFKPGEYCAFIQGDWNHVNINQFGFNMLCEEEIDYKVLDESGVPFLKKGMKSYAQNNVKKFRAVKGGKGMEIKHETGKNTGGYGFYYYENNNENGAKLVEKLKFPKSTGYRFLYDQPLLDYYVADVQPGKNMILLIKKIALNTKLKFVHVTKAVKK